VLSFSNGWGECVAAQRRAPVPKNLDCSSEVCASQIVAMRARLTPMSSATDSTAHAAGRGGCRWNRRRRDVERRYHTAARD